MQHFKRKVSLPLFFCLMSFYNYTHEPKENPVFSLQIDVTGIETGDGYIFIAIYAKPEDFLSETMFKGLRIPVQNRKVLKTTLELPQGSYAMAVFHDENSDGVMNRNFFQVPTEPYGFSNKARAILNPPRWDEAAISLNSHKTEVISLK